MKTHDTSSRCSDLWQRLIGLFGADAVRRKFGDSPPPEWVSVIASLDDFQLQRGMRRLVYSGKAHVPTLPEFVKLCRTVGIEDEGPSEPAGPALEDPVMRMPHHRHLCCLWFMTRCQRAGGFKRGGDWITRLRIAAQTGADEWQVMNAEGDPEATVERLYAHLDRILADMLREKAVAA